MIAVELGEVNKTVSPAVVPKNVRKLGLAELALELPPLDGRVVSGLLPVLLRFQPVLNALIVDEFHAAPTLANLQKRIVFIVLVHPADSTLWQRI